MLNHLAAKKKTPWLRIGSMNSVQRSDSGVQPPLLNDTSVVDVLWQFLALQVKTNLMNWMNQI